jgi:hypothetical protein
MASAPIPSAELSESMTAVPPLICVLPTLLFSGDQLSFPTGHGAMSHADFVKVSVPPSRAKSSAGRSDFWMYDTSGVLRPAVRAYLNGRPMTAKNIAAIRTYLRVWIFAPEFDGEGVEKLRQAVDGLASREAIEEWLAMARKEWISPL